MPATRAVRVAHEYLDPAPEGGCVPSALNTSGAGYGISVALHATSVTDRVFAFRYAAELGRPAAGRGKREAAPIKKSPFPINNLALFLERVQR